MIFNENQQTSFNYFKKIDLLSKEELDKIDFNGFRDEVVKLNKEEKKGKMIEYFIQQFRLENTSEYDKYLFQLLDKDIKHQIKPT